MKEKIIVVNKETTRTITKPPKVIYVERDRQVTTTKSLPKPQPTITQRNESSAWDEKVSLILFLLITVPFVLMLLVGLSQRR